MSDERFSVPAPRVGVHAVVTMRNGAVVDVRLAREAAAESPVSDAARAIHDTLARHLERGDADLSRIPVDLSALPAFHREALEFIRALRSGQTMTYGEVAARLGKPGAARAVGAAMAANPIPLIVPCHRVLGADGALHGYTGAGGLVTKARLLELERFH